MTEAIDTAITAARADYGSVEYDGVEYPIARKPNALLLAELARTGSGDPEAFGVIAEFFAVTLGADTYRKFKRAIYDNDASEEALMLVLQEILETTIGRPTE